MSDTTTPTRKKRRSRAFMDKVGVMMDSCSMKFIDAVRYVDESDDFAPGGAHEQREAEKASEEMRLTNQLETWNATVPEGTTVMARSIVGGPEWESKTRSKAWFACGHNLVLLEGRSGGWNLDFVRAIR